MRAESIRPHAEFKFPNFFGQLSARTETRNAGILKGDRVAVVGASGNVGRLVALRLADLGACKVRAIARNGDRAAEFLSVSDVDIEVFSADTKDRESLSYALEDCDALVIVTGTTAFPTLAWRNGNTPDAVDNQGVRNILEVWQKSPSKSKKRVVLMSSIGVDRRKNFPFVVLNAAGVLDAKAAGETALRDAASGASAWLESFAIVRPGQLIGGPYDNNYYLGTLAKLDRPARSILLWDTSAKNAIEVARGDTLLGDTLRSTVAEVIVRSLLAPGGRGCSDFSVVNTEGPSPTETELQLRLDALE